jgi:choline/glycine/proline betaine transport protein
MRAYLEEHTNPPVFITSAIVVLALVAFGAAAPGLLGSVATSILNFITGQFGWLLVISVTFFLVFCVWLMFSRYGKIRLGKDDERPEYGTLPWFAMLFTAGMGIGLVYFGVAEPVAHFTEPPMGEGGTVAAAREAMNLTYFHWLLHPWAIYIVLGLALGYAVYRKDLPMRPAAIFYPLIGDRIHGPVGHTIDVIAVFGTIFGLATSLGFGASQIGAGIEDLFGVSNTVGLQIGLILGITAIAIVSLMLGIDRGIRRLAELNLLLAVSLAVFVFIVGPTVFILTSFAGNLGTYLQSLIDTSLNMFSFSESGTAWQADWTLFYWAWWISWSPFVGMFIARISRGRTIREFVAGVLFAPAGASAVWFTIFGGTALRQMLAGDASGLADAPPESALFVLLDSLPAPATLATVFAAIGILVVVLFFATSSDSGSLVVDILTNGGNPQPVWQQRLFWAVTEGAVAAVLLYAGSATGEDPLTALQTASLASGLPFCVVLLVMCFSMIKAFREDPLFAATADADAAHRGEPAAVPTD